MSEAYASYFPPSVLEATEDTCQREPLAARTRLALLKLEKEGHRAGWDSATSDPTIFRVEHNPVNDFIAVHQSNLTTALRMACNITRGDVGEALQLVARATEQSRDALETAFGLAEGRDAIRSGAGYRFYGYAFRNEGWAVPSLNNAKPIPPEIIEALQRKQVHVLPNRIETRMVHLVARDGLTWWIQRRRLMPPVEAVVTRPEGDFTGSGLVLNALGRMTNAAAGNVVPVADLASMSDIVGVRRDDRDR